MSILELFQKPVRCVAVMAAAAVATAAPSISASAMDAPRDFGGESIVIQVYGGSIARFFSDKVIPAFEKKYNAKVTMVEGLTSDIVAKIRVAKGNNPPVDTFMLAETGAVAVATDNLTEPLTVKAVPNLEHLIPSARRPGDPFVAIGVASMAIAYNNKLLQPKDLPKTWADLANPIYKGKLLLPYSGSLFASMLIAQLAISTGGSIDNIDSALKEIEKFQPNVLTYWTSYDQTFNLLNSGEALLAVTATDRTIFQIKSGAPIGVVYPADGVALIANGIGVAKGTAHKALAETYINYVLSADVNQLIADNTGFIPSNKDAVLDPKLAALLPSAGVMEKSAAPDWQKVSKYMPGWMERYTKEVVNK